MKRQLERERERESWVTAEAILGKFEIWSLQTTLCWSFIEYIKWLSKLSETPLMVFSDKF